MAQKKKMSSRLNGSHKKNSFENPDQKDNVLLKKFMSGFNSLESLGYKRDYQVEENLCSLPIDTKDYSDEEDELAKLLLDSDNKEPIPTV